MNILVTGAAGFIGSNLVKALLARKHRVVGLDNINSYYDTRLKYARLADTGIVQGDIRDGKMTVSSLSPDYHFMKLDLTDRIGLNSLFASEGFDMVVNMAAQAGVRYSIENPYAYIDSNVVGFLNLLECCRHHAVKTLLYASSSSVYGSGNTVPYSENDVTDSPVSLYAATKKADELMAHVYHNLYGLTTVGLRFFTVYGPAGRPDMAPFLFLKSILEGKPIRVFNYGRMSRDFTYIDDITEGVMQIVDRMPTEKPLCSVYNIGRSEPVQLMDFIHVLEKVSGRKAVMELTDMQPGDVLCTYADTTRLYEDFGYHPSVSIEEGIRHFYEWYLDYTGSQKNGQSTTRI